MTSVVLLGGPFSMQKVELSETPPRIEIRGRTYARVDDPETGESLDGYAFEQHRQALYQTARR